MNQDCALLCRMVEWIERQAHIVLGKNVELEVSKLIEKLREKPND